MPNWTPTKRACFLTYLTRFDLVEALERVDERWIADIQGELVMGLYIRALKSYKDSAGTQVPNRMALCRTIDEEAQEFPGAMSDSRVVDETKRIAGIAFDVSPEDLAGKDVEEDARKLLRQFLIDFHFRRKLRAVAGKSDLTLGSLDAALFDLQGETHQMDSSLTPEVVQPLATPFDLVNPIETIPIEGMPFLEEILGEGLRPGETYLVVGPTSGGKTLLSVQLSTGFARRKPVYYATYEQEAKRLAEPDNPDSPYYSEYTIRGLGPAAGVSRSMIQKAEGDLSNLPPDKVEEIKQMAETPLAINWKVHNYTSLGGVGASISSLLQNIRTWHEKREALGMVVIDPFMPLLHKTALARGLSTDPSQLRSEGMMLMERLHDLGQELGIIIVVVHQLSAKAATGSASSLTAYGAAEIKTLSWHLENVLAISRMNGRNHCKLILAKGRNAGKKGSRVTVELDGDMNRFTKVHGRAESGYVDLAEDPEGGPEQVADFVTSTPEEPDA